jgi:hypothetical protein
MNEGGNSKFFGQKNVYESNQNTLNLVQLGEVISVDDPNYLGRIKVRIKGSTNRGGDDGVSDENLPWCFPLIPKLLSVQPKVKEAVYIFIFNFNKEHADRMYIGPIISQPQQLNFDPYYISALRGFSFRNVNPTTSVETIPELRGIFPDNEDVSIQGRFNTDITQKNNEVLLRAGKFEYSTPSSNNPFSIKFNKETQGYIQIKNGVVIKKATKNEKAQTGTVINAVANKINLLTHKDGNPRFDLTNQDNLISDDVLEEILQEAHQLPFGDVLLEYLILLKEALLYHVHNGSGNPATDLTTSGNKQAIAAFKAKADELEKAMLSKNIRIN